MKKVAYRLAAVLKDTDTEIVSIPKGQDFELVMKVRDLRPAGMRSDGRPLFRGVFAAYMSLRFDRSIIENLVIELQNLSLNPPTPNGYFQLALGNQTVNVGYNFSSMSARLLTCSMILQGVNRLFGSRVARVTQSSILGSYQIEFIGLRNMDVPNLSSPTEWASISEVLKGDPKEAKSIIRSIRFSDNYPNGKQAEYSDKGLNRVGSFGGISAGLGTRELEVLRIPMTSKASGTVSLELSLDDIRSPMEDTLVFTNDWSESQLVLPDEIERIGTSLVIV